ncbi:MAG: anhydro-N-acetylmuramic acid kinase [Edaphocola sp.]
MVYNVIGLMSGSSLDGLDIAFCQLTEISGKWTYEILRADCITYPDAIAADLKNAANISVPGFLRLHSSYGHYLGEQVNKFIAAHSLEHKVHFIASHGHTVWHEPAAHTTSQIGDGAAIAAWTLLPVVSDLRAMDVALGGQGAPIVPIADKYLFGDYDFCLNIGGIANVTINGAEPIAFDICPANQLLNYFANKAGKEYDENGALARTGTFEGFLLDKIGSLDFYEQPAPKSLHNGFVHEVVLPHFAEDLSVADALATAVQHIAEQIANALITYRNPLEEQKMLVTGGGALNGFLIEKIDEALNKGNSNHIEAIVPNEQTVQYKEALAMALIGTLRWREETNVLGSVTGAGKNSVNGAMWLPPVD